MSDSPPKDFSDYFTGFSKLSREERYQRLQQMGALTAEDIAHLSNQQNLAPELAEHFIENVIGYFHMPLGVATNFKINGVDKVIPMAVEETSIVAAASKTAKWIRQNGEITTESRGKLLIGQIQISHVQDYAKLERILADNKAFLIETANEDVAHGLVRRGGGVHDITLRHIDRGDGCFMAVLHVLVDTCDAMGANIINQVCEYLKPKIENLSGEHINMCILSNLADKRLTHAKVVIRNIDPELGAKIQEASIFAECDPYRATTSNKGVLNGMDSVLLASGNDWRAVEAGVHAYAARDGQYRSITQWRVENGDLIGTLIAPICVGTVGGVTRLHPTAKLCLRMLDVKHADELAQIVAAVGLVQNLGAITALTTVGIIQGHMKLHISNLALSAGADEKEMPLLEKRLEKILQDTQRLSLQHAEQALKAIRAEAVH